jgi:hypothetical protein
MRYRSRKEDGIQLTQAASLGSLPDIGFLVVRIVPTPIHLS